MRQLAKVSSARLMPSGHGRCGPSVRRRPAHGGRGAKRPSMQEQCGCGLHSSRGFIRIQRQGRAKSIVVSSRRAVSRPSRAWCRGVVGQRAVAQRSAGAVRPPAASARWVRRVASSMQQPNTLVPFRPGVVCSTTATPNHSVKPTCLRHAAYLKR